MAKQSELACGVLLLAGAGLLIMIESCALAGPTSGGRSRGSNAWGGGNPTVSGPASAPPVYVVPGTPTSSSPAANGSYYYAPDPAGGEGAGIFAVLAVQVPANAEIWLNDYKTKLSGPAREFITPPLAEDLNYHYRVRVRWMENGHEIVQERDVPVAPRTRTSIRFGG